MPEMGGLETLQELMQIDRTLNVIMLSCSNEVGTVVEAIRLGAHDYLTKPFEKTELDAAMLKSRQKKELTQENQALRDYCEQVTEDLSFLAASPQMVRIRQQILQIAPVDVPVFICGESGVGKEVVARMIHLRSKRRNQPFIKVNCAALPGELLESELFGFEQGAFTGAVRAKPGKFELANKGTIFLDEIAEMSVHLQAKLLHVLQDHQYSRLGGRHLIDTDVRVLAATNVDVQEAMKAGRFREDLYYRLERAFDQCAAAAGENFGNSAAVQTFPGEVQREIRKDAAESVEAPAGCGDELSVAGQFARTGEFREAVRDSGRRRRQLARAGGDVCDAAADFAAAGNAGAARASRTESAGARIEGRSGDGSDRGCAGEDAVVPQGRSEDAGHQLQGAAL